MKVTASSSYSVCLTFLVRNGNEYYLLDLWRKRVEFPDLVEAVRSQAAKHNPTAILIEEQASGAPLIAECKRRGMTGIIGRRPVADNSNEWRNSKDLGGLIDFAQISPIP